MKEIFKTETDGWCSQEKLYWDFIKSVEMTEQYKLWHEAMVDKTIKVHD